jgi:type II secretory pathway component PulF
MIYGYRAKKGPQDVVEGTIEAETEKDAVEKLSAMGYLPVRLWMMKQTVTRNSSFRQDKIAGGDYF